MAITAFDDFVRREQRSAQDLDDQPIDWQANKAEWLAHLDELFAMVGEFLKTYVAQSQVSIAYKQVELNEEYIGPYSAKAMVISIGSKVIKLEPIGTMLIGSKGRVDVSGPFGHVQLLLLSKTAKSASDLIHVSVSFDGVPALPPPRPQSKIEWAWKIVSRPPRREFIELNKETFLSLLLEVSNG
jgi:hypothetical protein